MQETDRLSGSESRKLHLQEHMSTNSRLPLWPSRVLHWSRLPLYEPARSSSWRTTVGFCFRQVSSLHASIHPAHLRQPRRIKSTMASSFYKRLPTPNMDNSEVVQAFEQLNCTA